MRSEEPAATMRVDPTVWIAGLAALAIYFPGMWWGLPRVTAPSLVIHGWDVDGVSGIAPLAEFHNLLVAAKPDWYVAYPLFHYLVLGCCYAPYLGYLLLSGGLSSPTGQYPYGLADPAGSLFTLALIGRMVTLCMACGVVMAAYLAARTVWDKATGILTAAIVALIEPVLYYARTGNLDIPVLFWMALGVLGLARAFVFGLTVRRALAIGTCAALSVATKDQAVGAWLPAVVMLIIIHRREAESRRSATSGARRWMPSLALLVSGSVVYALANGVLLSPQRLVAHLNYLAHFEDTFFYVAQLGLLRPRTVAGYLTLIFDTGESLREAIGPALLGTALAGVLVIWRSTPFAKVLIAMLLGHLFLVILPVRHMQYRYVILPAFVLALFAARVLVLGLRGRPAVKALAIAVLLAGFGRLGVRGADLTYQMLFDARLEAGRWLAANAGPGDQVAYFGLVDQLPRFPSGAQPWRLPAGESALALLGSHRARFVLVSADWTSDAGMEHSRFMPERAYERLQDGTLGYQRLARFSTPSLLGRPLKYLPFVNPTVQVFGRIASEAEPD